MNILKEFKTHIKIKGYSNAYITPVKLYLEYLEEHSIDYKNINYTQYSEFILYLQEEDYEEQYINSFINGVKYFYKFLLLKGDIEEKVLDEIKKIKMLKAPEKIRVYITREELDEIIEMAMSFTTFIDPIKLKTILHFLYYTGVRISEFTNLKRKDIDLKELTAIIRTPTKNKQERTICFTKKVGELIQEYYSIEPHEVKNAFNMSNGQMERLINDIRAYVHKDKRGDFTPHTFRHSFARMLARKGVGIRYAQKLLGHKDIESTLRYYKVEIQDVKNMYREKIGRG